MSGSLYIDPLQTGYAALGSAAEPITGQFKGRGNWTWNGFDKKPYRIKFDAKQKVLGMPKNKHWCLLAGADDNLGYLKNYIGFKLSEAIGLRWTPGLVPVELVMNGQYQGIYFLTEQIRVGSNRVDVTEQEDNAIDSVSGGWLVEIDNYYEEGNVTFYEGNGQQVWVTMKSPEILSSEQRTYIENQLNGLNTAIGGSNETDLWNRIDLDEAVKYYLVQEIMEDCESYHGSCYLYKDRDRNGIAEKWFFGPVWDFDWGTFLAKNVKGWKITSGIWFAALMSNDVFKKTIQERWAQYKTDFEQIPFFIDSLVEYTKESNERNYAKWPISNKSSEFPDRDKPFDEAISMLRSTYISRISEMDTLINGL